MSSKRKVVEKLDGSPELKEEEGAPPKRERVSFDELMRQGRTVPQDTLIEEIALYTEEMEKLEGHARVLGEEIKTVKDRILNLQILKKQQEHRSFEDNGE